MITLPLPPHKVAAIIAHAELVLAMLDAEKGRPPRPKPVSLTTRADSAITRCTGCDTRILPEQGEPPVCDTCAARALVAMIKGAA